MKSGGIDKSIKSEHQEEGNMMQDWESLEFHKECKRVDLSFVDGPYGTTANQGDDNMEVHSSQLNSTLLKAEEDTAKNSMGTLSDVKKKGVCISLLPIRQVDTCCSTAEKGEPSCRTCVICDDAKPSRTMKQLCALHYGCQDCLRSYVGKKIQENIKSVKCPERDCKEILELKFCYKLVPEGVIHRCKSAIRENEALAYPKLIHCPFIDCSDTFLDDRRQFKIKACPRCSRIFCMDCKVEWHMGMTCNEHQQLSRISFETWPVKAGFLENTDFSLFISKMAPELKILPRRK